MDKIIPKTATVPRLATEFGKKENTKWNRLGKLMLQCSNLEASLAKSGNFLPKWRWLLTIFVTFYFYPLNLFGLYFLICFFIETLSKKYLVKSDLNCQSLFDTLTCLLRLVKQLNSRGAKNGYLMIINNYLYCFRHRNC